jgi:hypothetical protein
MQHEASLDGFHFLDSQLVVARQVFDHQRRHSSSPKKANKERADSL